MLRARAHADCVSKSSVNAGNPGYHLQLPWRLDGAGVRKEAREAAMGEYLNCLCHAGRKLASALHGGKLRNGSISILEQWLCKKVSGADGILNGQVDSNSSSGRHGVSCVSNAKQSRGEPFPQAVDLHGQDFDLFPIAQFAYALVKIGSDPANLRA
jgi:hypothetical protein